MQAVRQILVPDSQILAAIALGIRPGDIPVSEVGANLLLSMEYAYTLVAWTTPLRPVVPSAHGGLAVRTQAKRTQEIRHYLVMER